MHRGQLFGGPDDGNFIDSTVDEVKFRATFEWDQDGEGFTTRTTIYGRYIWDPEQGVFRWNLGLAGGG